MVTTYTVISTYTHTRFSCLFFSRPVASHSGIATEASLVLYFYQTAHAVYEEYLLCDTNTLLSDLGGSLGLFLGFSCLHLVWMGLGAFRHWRKAKSALERRRERRRNVETNSSENNVT